MKIHIDIDCFFVSAHRSIDETLNNIPLAVGGRSNLSIFEETTQIRHISRVRGAFTSSILSSNGDKTFQE
jgi:DNA polymerase-4